MKRAIVLFPSFENMDHLNNLRDRFDPLANYIAPHITVVFPFESDLSTSDLRLHIRETLRGIKRFHIQLKDVTGDFRDGYLFLNVKKGNDPIIELHDRLYSGILECFLLRKVTFCPHITVGRVQQQIEFDQAIDELGGVGESFETVMDQVSLVNIDDMEHSSIEFLFDLE